MQLHETEAVTEGVIPVAFQEVGPQEVETSLCMQEATVQQGYPSLHLLAS